MPSPSAAPTRAIPFLVRVFGAAALLCSTFASPAHAADAEPVAPEISQHRLTWHWRRVALWEYLATAAVGASAVYVELRTEQPTQAKWKSPVWFDSQARDTLRLSSSEGREKASASSDYLSFGTQVWSYVDASIVPLVSDDWNLDVAWQMTLINLQTSALTGLVTRSLYRTVARERPDVEPCRNDPEYHEMCFTGTTTSFPSGHTAGAFAGAGLVCSHHLAMPLYGAFAADALACGVSASMAVSVAILRLQADRHYVSDVMTAALLGTATGLALPTLGHYWFIEVPHGGDATSRVTVAPLLGSAWGATVFGSL